MEIKHYKSPHYIRLDCSYFALVINISGLLGLCPPTLQTSPSPRRPCDVMLFLMFLFQVQVLKCGKREKIIDVKTKKGD